MSDGMRMSNSFRLGSVLRPGYLPRRRRASKHCPIGSNANVDASLEPSVSGRGKDLAWKAAFTPGERFATAGSSAPLRLELGGYAELDIAGSARPNAADSGELGGANDRSRANRIVPSGTLLSHSRRGALFSAWSTILTVRRPLAGSYVHGLLPESSLQRALGSTGFPGLPAVPVSDCTCPPKLFRVS